MIPFRSPLDSYSYYIQSGDIAAGKWIIIVYKRLIEGISNGTYVLDLAAGKKAVDFIENFCHHSKGRNDLIKLELWQQAAVYAIFAVKDHDGLRQWREVVLIVGRKNGKSSFAAAIQAYMAFVDGEYGAEIYDIAPKLDQAHIVFDAFSRMVDAEPELAELVRKRRTDIFIDDTNTICKALAFNEKKSDGLNPHLVVCDEIASWPAAQGLKQYEVIKSAFGSRLQPMLLSISTAGYINDGIYDELMMRSTSWLMGGSSETRLLPLLYMIDDAQKWDDIEELKKANPNMGISVQPAFFLEEIAVARQSLSKRAEFLTKYCNIKQNSSQAWLPYDVVDAATGEHIDIELLRHCYAVGGIDLSQTTDLTAACVIVEKNGRLYIIAQAWMPANKIDELSEVEGVPYRIYEQKGWIRASGENYVDYHDCYNWFVDLVEKYEILPLKVGYDRYSAQYLVQEMRQYGFHMDDVFQGENLTPVLREMDGLLRDGVVCLGDNQVLKAHFLNVGVKINVENRKFRPIKIDWKSHIDVFVAVCDAFTVRQKWSNEIGEQLRNAA